MLDIFRVGEVALLALYVSAKAVLRMQITFSPCDRNKICYFPAIKKPSTKQRILYNNISLVGV